MSQVPEQFLPAFVQALILCVVRVFTIPWRIWNGAMQRLATLRENDQSKTELSAHTEFPVLEWFKTAWDGIIFLSWIVGPVIALFTALGVMSTWGFSAGIGLLITSLIWIYFSVIFTSLAKEFLILALSVALNIERIARRDPPV